MAETAKIILAIATFSEGELSEEIKGLSIEEQKQLNVQTADLLKKLKKKDGENKEAITGKHQKQYRNEQLNLTSCILRLQRSI